MNPRDAYSEDSLIEQPAIQLFAQIGWQTRSALDEVFGADGTLGRETKGEALLLTRLRTALERLNPTLPTDAIAQAIDQLSRDRSAMSLPAANREVYGLLKDGIEVTRPTHRPEAKSPSASGSSIGTVRWPTICCWSASSV
jgi:type I restriction enzyme R subunit